MIPAFIITCTSRINLWGMKCTFKETLKEWQKEADNRLTLFLLSFHSFFIVYFGIRYPLKEKICITAGI